MSELNPRLNAFRTDLADEALKDLVPAPRYAVGEAATVCALLADLRRDPSQTAALDSQLLLGERLKVFDIAGDWAWVQNEADGYVGYVAAELIARRAVTPTHRVVVPRTILFSKPDIKSRSLGYLSLGSRVAGNDEQGKFLKVEEPNVGREAWLYRPHLFALDDFLSDHVSCARRFLETPYLWGGRSAFGLDCSALVQLALAERGIFVQRDSSMQETTVGMARPPEEPPAYGDLIYFPGHVAIALNATEVIHANAHSLSVVVEPLDDLVARVRAESGGTGITAIRRI
jgi:hypothetical protein